MNFNDSLNKLFNFSEICFKDSTVENADKEQQDKTHSVRSLLAEHIGKLITVKGIITKNTEVKPLLSVATYTCDQCGRESSQTVIFLFKFQFIYLLITN